MAFGEIGPADEDAYGPNLGDGGDTRRRSPYWIRAEAARQRVEAARTRAVLVDQLLVELERRRVRFLAAES